MTFADILGYSFRKKIALTIERQAVRHDVANEAPVNGEEDTRTVQLPWTGGGAFDELEAECPFPFHAWVLCGETDRIKVRGAMDISRIGPAEPYGIPHGMRADRWWRGMNLDVWLKTPMLTFNRIFPHEINRFVPLLSDAEEVAKHLKFASMLDLKDAFSEAYLAGLNPEERLQGADVLNSAERLACAR